MNRDIDVLKYENLEVDYDGFCKKYGFVNNLPLSPMNKNVYKWMEDGVLDKESLYD